MHGPHYLRSPSLNGGLERALEPRGAETPDRLRVSLGGDTGSNGHESVRPTTGLSSRRAFLGWSLCGAVSLTGCQVFDGTALPALYAVRKELPQPKPLPDAVRLDVVFVERPDGDALVGSEMWQHVDQVAAFDTTSRNQLAGNGMRVGVVGSRPPAAVQTLLGLSADFVHDKEAEKKKQLVGHSVVLRSGNSTEIVTSAPYPLCELHMSGTTGQPTHSLSHARCGFKVSAHRLEDGWVTLDFVPQIRHGQERMRHVAGSEGWQFSMAQDLHAFNTHKFSTTLSVGEMVIMTAGIASRQYSLGEWFFRPPGESMQRVLIIRVADAGTRESPFGNSSPS